jgi:hypothetical protein
MMENLSERERKLVLALVPTLLICGFVYFWTEPAEGEPALVMDTAAAIDTARLRLDKLRATAAQIPAMQESRKVLDTNLAGWEKRLITADTPAQAQAQLNQIFRRVARLQGPAVEVRNVDIGAVLPAQYYSEIRLGVVFDCQVEGLVNLLTELSGQPEFLSWRDLRVVSQDSKQKRINVSFTLVGLAPLKLAPKPVGGNIG